jgi:hypothetical protein
MARVTAGGIHNRSAIINMPSRYGSDCFAAVVRQSKCGGVDFHNSTSGHIAGAPMAGKPLSLRVALPMLRLSVPAYAVCAFLVGLLCLPGTRSVNGSYGASAFLRRCGRCMRYTGFALYGACQTASSSPRAQWT